MKYLLIVLLSLYVFSSGAGSRVILNEEGKEVSIGEFIRKDTPKDSGFFNVYVQDGRYYLEIPDDKLQRDILVAVTIVKGAAQKERSRTARFGYGGDSVFDRMIRFTKNRDRIEIVSPQVVTWGILSDCMISTIKIWNLRLSPLLGSRLVPRIHIWWILQTCF